MQRALALPNAPWRRLFATLGLFSLLAIAFPITALAQSSIELSQDLCTREPVGGSTVTSASRAGRCADPEGRANQWVWLDLRDLRRLDALDGGWHLLLPHRHLSAIAVVFTYHDGEVRTIRRTYGPLAIDWLADGHPAFVSPRPGRDLTALSIAFKTQNNAFRFRQVLAVSAQSYLRRFTFFKITVGLYLGAVGSAFIYNLFIDAGLRQRFQRVYLVWGGLALANGLLTSGVLAEIWPTLAGPAGLIANRIVAAALFASATFFLLTLIEPGKLPRSVMRMAGVIAVAMAATGPLAILDAWLPTGPVNQLSTGLIVLNLAVVIIVAGFAIWARSRAIWFFLAGWAPVMCFALFLIANNFGIVHHSELRDLGGMLAVTIESIVLSLGIADRFRLIKFDRDRLERAQQIAEIDRAALQRVADTDLLTGLCNRHIFDATLSAATTGEISSLTLILIDIDRFKSINDDFGHEIGDALLVKVAHRLRACVRATDIVARLGGDEFALLVRDGDFSDLERIKDALGTLHDEPIANAERVVSISAGMAQFPHDDDDPSRLYRNADLALYEAKRLGRACICHYVPALRIRDERRHLVKDD